MSNLLRRLKRLESQRVDITGVTPHPDAWFVFWEEKLDRLMAGEEIGNVRILLEVIDGIVAARSVDSRTS